jgi:hypothetical protein
MRIRNAVVAVVLAAAPLAACSSGDDEADADADAGEPATEDDGGDTDAGGDVDGGETDDGGETEAGGQDSSAGPGSDRPESVRDDYPIPFPSGWEVDMQGEIGMTDTSGAQLLYPNDAFDGVVAYYDDWFESQPDEFARTVTGDQIFYQLLGETLYQVAVTPDHEELGETWVLLQVFGGIEVN